MYLTCYGKNTYQIKLQCHIYVNQNFYHCLFNFFHTILAFISFLKQSRTNRKIVYWKCNFRIFQPITNGVITNNNLVNTNYSSCGSKKVIDVVDLDDDDDAPSAPAPLRQNQVVIPTGQVRIVSNTQTLTYTNVSNAATGTTMTGPAGMNRVLIRRPQQPGQVLVTRNGMVPDMARGPQVIQLNS